MKAYSQDLRGKVIQAYEEDNQNSVVLSKQFRIHSSTIRRWLARYRETGLFESNQDKNRGRKLRYVNRETIIEFLNTHPGANGKIMRNALAPNIPISTFYKILERLEIPYKNLN